MEWGLAAGLDNFEFDEEDEDANATPVHLSRLDRAEHGMASICTRVGVCGWRRKSREVCEAHILARVVVAIVSK